MLQKLQVYTDFLKTRFHPTCLFAIVSISSLAKIIETNLPPLLWEKGFENLVGQVLMESFWRLDSEGKFGVTQRNEDILKNLFATTNSSYYYIWKPYEIIYFTRFSLILYAIIIVITIFIKAGYAPARHNSQLVDEVVGFELWWRQTQRSDVVWNSEIRFCSQRPI